MHLLCTLQVFGREDGQGYKASPKMATARWPHTVQVFLTLGCLICQRGSTVPLPLGFADRIRNDQVVSSRCQANIAVLWRSVPSQSSTHGPETTIRLRTLSKPRSPRFRHSPENSTRRPWKFSCSKMISCREKPTMPGRQSEGWPCSVTLIPK